MNKPEFPKPRLIREDFMPEKEFTTDYRIKKIIKGNEVEFLPQRKFLWFWINIMHYSTDDYDWAICRIKSNIQKRAKSMIEYLDVTPEKLAQDPTSPPVDDL
jgi:hypothetical protein